MGFSNFLSNREVSNIELFLFSLKILLTKFNFKDLIAKLCAISGSILKIKDLNLENIILIYLL